MGTQLVGESFGVSIIECKEPIEGLAVLDEYERKTGVYCYSNTILPPFQGKGLGKILKAHWLGIAVGNGFRVVYGHARPGASQALNAKFGATFVRSFPNWYETGEEYRMYKLRLVPLRS